MSLGSVPRPPRHGKHLLLAAAQLVPLVVDALLETREEGENPVEMRVQVLGAVDGNAADLEVLIHGEVGEHLAVLPGSMKSPASETVCASASVMSVPSMVNIAAAGRQQSHDRLHGGGFARPVPAEEGHRLAFADFQAQVVEHVAQAVKRVDGIDFEHYSLRYTRWTSAFARTSSTVPSARKAPLCSTVILSEMPSTTSMSCSTSTMVSGSARPLMNSPV